MKLPLIHILLSDGAAKAVCWTLVHSLWEGLLAALLAGLIILATRRQSAALRYNLLTADLLLFILIAGATFVYETGQDGRLPAPGMTRIAVEMTGSGAHNGPGRAIGKNTILPANKSGHLMTAPGILVTENLLQRASDYLNTHAVVVTLVWLACLSGQMLRLTLGLYQVRRLRRSNTIPPQPYWNERLLVLARRLGIKRTVTLLQSALVKAPSALGFLKPSILVPMGMLANLPPDQVETILLHELAHIRRGDYAANLLLYLTEAIFFFNPGIRWVATLIRQEREACCDDMVLARVPDKNSYFEALVSFKQWVIDGSLADGRSFTLQLGGGKTDLLWRIRRMLERENKKLQIMEKAILSFGLMALVTVSLISMRQKDIGVRAQDDNGAGAQAATISSIKTEISNAAETKTRNPAHTETRNPAHTETRVQLAAINGSPKNQERKIAVIALPQDTIPGEQKSPSNGQTRTFPSFNIHTDSDDGHPIRTSSATDDQGNRFEMRMVDGQVTEFKVNGQLVTKEDYGKYADFFAAEEERQKAPRRPRQPRAPRSMPGLPPEAPRAPEKGEGYSGTAQYEEAVRTYEEAERRYEEAQRRYEQAQRIYEERMRERGAGPTEPVSPASRISPVRPIAPRTGIVRPVQSKQPPTLSNPIIWNNPNPYLQKIVAELIESKLIDRVDEFSISLNADGMTINDVRQPEEVFAKFKAKYIRHENDHIIYSQYYRSDGSNGSHCEVNIEASAPGQTTENK